MVEKPQISYLASVNECGVVKMQQYLSLRSNVDAASYSPAAYLQAVVRWKQGEHLAQLVCTVWQWKGVVLERQGWSGSKGCVSAAGGAQLMTWSI